MTTDTRIREFVSQHLNRGRADMLTDDYPLIERKVIDSVGLFQLVAFLEREYDMVIDDEELAPDNFATIGAIVNFVNDKLSGSNQSNSQHS